MADKTPSPADVVSTDIRDVPTVDDVIHDLQDCRIRELERRLRTLAIWAHVAMQKMPDFANLGNAIVEAEDALKEPLSRPTATPPETSGEPRSIPNCEKCGERPYRTYSVPASKTYESGYVAWKYACGSSSDDFGRFEQSDACRRTELEQQLAAVKEERDAVRIVLELASRSRDNATSRAETAEEAVKRLTEERDQITEGCVQTDLAHSRALQEVRRENAVLRDRLAQFTTTPITKSQERMLDAQAIAPRVDWKNRAEKAEALIKHAMSLLAVEGCKIGKGDTPSERLMPTLAALLERVAKLERSLAVFARPLAPEPDRMVDPDGWRAWCKANVPK